MLWQEKLQKSIENQSRTLHLQKGDIEPQEMENLVTKLKDSQITFLNLENNEIGDEKAIYLVDQLNDKSQITSINLAGNKIKAKGLKALADGLSRSQISLGNMNDCIIRKYEANKILTKIKDIIENNRRKVSILIRRFENIFLNEKNEFKDLNQVEIKKISDFAATIELYGKNAFASYIKIFSKKLNKDQDINAQLTKLMKKEKEEGGASAIVYFFLCCLEFFQQFQVCVIFGIV